MCSSSHNSYSTTNVKQRKQFPLERRPKMLKDFLADDFGFKSFPRTVHSDSCLPNLILTSNISKSFTYNASHNSRNSPKLPRSRSISAFQAMINAVKNIHFSTVKTPSILPRSLSRRLSKRRLQGGNAEMTKSRVITVKDIVRWKSFGDIVEGKQEHFPPFDYTTTTTTTTTTVSTATTPSSSNASSWCDSDFTSEYLPEEYIDIEDGKKYLPCVGGDLIETIKKHSCHDSKVEEEHLHSPVSVIDFKLLEDEVSTSSFDQALANVERTKDMLMQKIRRFESLANQFEPFNSDKYMSMDRSSEEDDDEDEKTERSYHEQEEDDQIEEKVWQLLNHLKTTSRTPLTNASELPILDFLRDELRANKKENNKTKKRSTAEFYGSILDRAEGWINRESSLLVGLKELYNKGASLEEMNKGEMWSDFGEEKEELASAFESDVLGVLVDDILLDLISC